MERRLTLLLADDDVDDKDLFKEVLNMLASDVELKTFGYGKQAIDYLMHYRGDSLPCAIILDYNMPKMCAPQVLEWMQSMAKRICHHEMSFCLPGPMSLG